MPNTQILQELSTEPIVPKQHIFQAPEITDGIQGISQKTMSLIDGQKNSVIPEDQEENSERLLSLFNEIIANATRDIILLLNEKRTLIAEDIKRRSISKEEFEQRRKRIIQQINVEGAEQIVTDGLAECLKGQFTNEEISAYIQTFSNKGQGIDKSFLRFFGTLKNDEDKFLVYEYLYWNKAKIGNGVLSKLKQQSWYKSSKKFPIEAECAVCNTQNTYYLPRHLTEAKENCSCCNHNNENICQCEKCTSINERIKQSIDVLIERLRSLCEEHYSELLQIYQSINWTPEPSQQVQFTAYQKNRFRLDSDERNFLQFFAEYRKINPEIFPEEVLESGDYKNSKNKLIKSMLKKGVLYHSETFRILPSSNDFLMEILKHINVDFNRHGETMNQELRYYISRRNTEKTSFTDFTAHKLNKSCIFNINGIHQQLAVNPYFLEEYQPKEFSPTGQGKPNIFKSPHEKDLFIKLQLQYPDVIILPNFLIRNILDLNGHKDRLTPEERKYLWNALVDYIVCDQAGNLIKVIEAQIGKHHVEPLYVERDNIKKKLFNLLGIEFEEIHGKWHPEYNS